MLRLVNFGNNQIVVTRIMLRMENDCHIVSKSTNIPHEGATCFVGGDKVPVSEIEAMVEPMRSYMRCTWYQKIYENRLGNENGSIIMQNSILLENSR